MQSVTITRDLRPFRAGQTAILEDAVAQHLVATGEAKNPRPWPEAAESEKPKPSRHVGYQTRKPKQ